MVKEKLEKKKNNITLSHSIIQVFGFVHATHSIPGAVIRHWRYKGVRRKVHFYHHCISIAMGKVVKNQVK